MAGLGPAIHDLNTKRFRKAWMPGTGPGMTAVIPEISLSGKMVGTARPARLTPPR